LDQKEPFLFARIRDQCLPVDPQIKTIGKQSADTLAMTAEVAKSPFGSLGYLIAFEFCKDS
jgi:hypothetical protein